MPPTILLYRDATIDCPIREIAQGLNQVIQSCAFKVGTELAEISGDSITLESYCRLPSLFSSEAESADYVFIATRKRYENNYFFHTEGRIAIISFSNWELLTKVPVANGLILFITELLALGIGAGMSHDDSRGCIHDFRQAKTHVDFAMKAAFICDECKKHFENCKPNEPTKRMFVEICRCLDDLSRCSRENIDIAAHWRTLILRSDQSIFDVFICHNSAEKDEVRRLYRRLTSEGLRPWFDEDQLRPGVRWQRVLQDRIADIKTAAVFVGSSGFGPWQDMEIDAFLSEFVRRGTPVIPVILESCSLVPELPVFLRTLMWVDFRRTYPDPWSQLIWGVTGDRPSRS